MKFAPNSKQTFAIWCVLSLALALALIFLLQPKDQAIALRTLSLGVFTSLLALPIGILLAWVASGRGFIAALLRTFCIVGVLLPVFVHVTAWDAAFGKLGLLTSTFGDVLKPVVSRWPAAVWIHAMISAPQVAVLFLVAFNSPSETWQDALRLEVGPAVANMRILQWRFLPVMIAATLWTMICCSREIGVTDIYQIGTLAEQVYLGYSLGQLNAIGTAWTPKQLADAQNLGTGITLLVVAWLAASAMLAFFSMSRSVERSESQRPASPNNSSTLANVIGLVLLLVVVAVPIANLIGRVGFSVVRIDGQPTATWDGGSAIEAIGGVLTNFRGEFSWSFLIATAAAFIVVAIVLPTVWFARKSLMGKLLLAIVFALLAAVPGPSLGLFVGWLFNLSDISLVRYLYDRTIAAPVIANMLFCLPLAIPIFWGSPAGVS